MYAVAPFAPHGLDPLRPLPRRRHRHDPVALPPRPPAHPARRDPADLPALHEHLATALTDTHALLLQPDLRRFRPLLSALLLPPLTTLQTALREQDKLALTRAYCQELHAPLRALVARYPFTIGAHDELSLAEFTAFFHPDTGALRRFRDAHLAPLIVIHGQGFTPRPTPRTDEHPLSPAVLALLHRAALLGELAFPAGTLGLDLELELHCNADIECEYAVNAAGMWARELGQRNGVVIPNQAAEHYYLITEPTRPY